VLFSRTNPSTTYGWIVLAALLLTPGCAHFGEVSHWHPAQINVDGVSSLSVIDFRGENGEAVASAVTAQLYDGQFYAIVDRSQFPPITTVSHSSGLGNDNILQAAHHAGVDAVVTGDVIEYRCDDQTHKNTDVHFGMHSDDHGDHEHEGSAFGFSSTETLRREATVTIAFRLVNTSTGTVLASRQSSHSFSGEYDTRQLGLEIPTQGEVLTNLTNTCVDEFVTLLAPYEAISNVRIANPRLFNAGWNDARLGTRFAERGEWTLAEEHWQNALDKKPDHDVAMYNLALAAAARHDYARAEELAMQALRTRHSDVYTDGLEWIRQSRIMYDESQQQQSTRLMQTACRDWH